MLPLTFGFAQCGLLFYCYFKGNAKKEPCPVLPYYTFKVPPSSPP